MATFADLLVAFRREVVAQETGGNFEDDDLYEMLYNASVEIASHFGFPVLTDATATLVIDATSVTAPADMADVKSVTINGRTLDIAPYEVVLRKRSLASGIPRYFNFDPKRGGNIDFGPAAKTSVSAGSVVVEYVKSIDVSTLTSADSPWSGLLPDFHWVVPLRAGANVWDGMGDQDTASYFNGRSNQGLQLMAVRLRQPFDPLPLQSQGGSGQ